MSNASHVTNDREQYSDQRYSDQRYPDPRVPTRREGFLADMERTVPWARLRALVEPIYADPRARRARPLELDRLLRIYFLQRWYRLTDGAVREAIADSIAMRSFVCIGLRDDEAPEEAMIRRFRQLLQEYGLGEVIVQAADRHLRALGLAVAPGAIVDPTVISTGAHTRAPFAKIVDTAGLAAG
jgi:transposase, IS5 family